MAFTKRSWQDHLTLSFGQESETARAEKDGLVVGGVYGTTLPTISDGEFSRLQVDEKGYLRSNPVIGAVGTIAIALSGSAGTLTCPISGLMRYVTITTPALTGTGTATMRIIDPAGGTLFQQAQDESVVTTYGSIVPLLTTMNITVTANGTQDAAATVTANIYCG